MKYHINHVELIGLMRADIRKVTNNNGDVFFDGTFSVLRTSGTADYLPFSIPYKLVGSVKNMVDLQGRRLRLVGELRSYNKEVEGKIRHHTVLFVKEIKEENQTDDDNHVELEGVICRPTKYRETPFGREICDFMVAVDRSCRRSSYIPCIAWGMTARRVSALEVGTKVKLTGRFQSREYFKTLDNGEMVPMTANEVSCKRVDEVKEAEEWMAGSV